MAVSSVVHRDSMGHVVRVADWQRRPVGARDSSGRRDTGPFLSAAFAASAVGFSSSGMLAAVRWTERGLELHTAVAVLLGVAVLGGVAALVRFLDLQHGSAGNDDANDEVAIPGDNAGEGTHVTVHRSDDDWALRIHRLETVAESTRGAATRDEAAADVQEIRDAIDEAGLRTIRTAAIRLFEDADGSWRWSLIHSNGTTLATAARASESRSDARDAVTTVTDHGADAAVLDARSVAFAVVRRDGRWYWQLLDAERTPLVASADGYADPERADAAIDPFLDALEAARVMTVDPVAIELYDDGDEWSWRFVDEANDVVADATGGFDTRRDAETAADAIRSGLESAAVTVAGEPAYERYREDDRWHWRLLDGTDRVVARTPDGASNRDDAARTAELFAEHAPDADVLELEEAAFEVFPENAPNASGTDESPTPVDCPEARTDGASPASVGSSSVGSSERSNGAWGETTSDGSGSDTSGETESGESGRTSSDTDVPSAGTTTAAEPVDEAVPDSSDSSNSPDSSDSPDEPMGARGESAFDRRVESDESGDDPADDGDGWHWRLVTTQRDVVAVGPEPAATPEAVDGAIDRVREQAREADLIEFEDAAFRVYETDSGEWRWRLIDEDGSVLADSGTEHDSRTEAAEAMVTLKQQAPDADVLEIETAAFELFVADDGWRWRLIDSTGKLVARGPSVHPTRDAAREAMTRLVDHLDADVHRLERPVFQSYPADEWRWRFVLPEGDAIAVAGDGYTTRDELVEHLEKVRERASDAHTHEVGTYSIQLADHGDWSFRILDRNRESVAESKASYADRSGAREAVATLTDHAADAPIVSSDTAVIRIERDGDEWRWSAVSSDRETLGVAVDTVGTESAARSAIDETKRLAPSAERIDRTGASFDLVETDGGRWRWRLLDGDGTVVATATDSWSSVEAVRDAVDDVRSSIEQTSVFELEGPAFELFVAEDGWRWRLVDATETVLLESTRAYETQGDASDAIEWLEGASLEEQIEDVEE